MREAVGQRCRHGIGDAAIALAIAGGEDGPARRHFVGAEAAIEDELIGGGGDGRRGGGDLVQKQYAIVTVAGRVRQHGRDGPLDEILDPERNAAQVGRLQLRQANIDHGHGVVGGHLGHHLRFADTRRTPEHHRGVVAGARTEIFIFENLKYQGRPHSVTPQMFS